MFLFPAEGGSEPNESIPSVEIGKGASVPDVYDYASSMNCCVFGNKVTGDTYFNIAFVVEPIET